MSDYFHVSTNPPPAGTALESRFFKTGTDPQFVHVVFDAASIGPTALRLLLLMEELMALRQGGEALAGNAYREIVYEEVRASHFPHLPSRTNCVYLFDDKGTAERFRSRFRQKKGSILVCSLEEGEPFIPDMNLLVGPDVHLADAGLAKMQAAAAQYWAGTMSNDPWPEVLVRGRVVVCGQA